MTDPIPLNEQPDPNAEVRDPNLNVMPAPLNNPGTYDLSDPEVATAYSEYITRVIKMGAPIGMLVTKEVAVRVTDELMQAGTKLTDLGVTITYQGRIVLGMRAKVPYPPSGSVDLIPVFAATEQAEDHDEE